jgi:hypothetical protein
MRANHHPLPNGRGPTRGSERGEGLPSNQRSAAAPSRYVLHRRALTPDAAHPTLSHSGEGR